MKRCESLAYSSWCAMKTRCLNENHRHYHRYGGRGITICPRWLNSFDNFVADMGERPSGTSLDRINNDGNYEPGNCRWAPLGEQNFNRFGGTKAKTYWYRGQQCTVRELAKMAGLTYSCMLSRLRLYHTDLAMSLKPFEQHPTRFTVQG